MGVSKFPYLATLNRPILRISALKSTLKFVSLYCFRPFMKIILWRKDSWKLTSKNSKPRFVDMISFSMKLFLRTTRKCPVLFYFGYLCFLFFYLVCFFLVPACPFVTLFCISLFIFFSLMIFHNKCNVLEHSTVNQ